MGNFLIAALVLAAGAARLTAQTAELIPDELKRVPLAGVGGGAYWQQLLITLAHDDTASVSAITVSLPEGTIVRDSDGDGLLADEVRLAYAAVAEETPGFFVATTSTQDTLIIGSSQAAGAGGRLYVQFPISNAITQFTGDIFHYGEILFADPRETDIAAGPELTLVSPSDFAALGSMGVVSFTPLLAAGVDTTTTPAGEFFPELPETLVFSLPGLAVDDGITTANNLLGFGDGTVYRFFFSQNGTLATVDTSSNEVSAALTADGREYLERDGDASAVRLLTRDLPAGTTYLYATSNVTGGLPLGRSRGIAIQHQPQILQVGTAAGRSITLDSGGLYDLMGVANGNSVRSATLQFAAIDHDDSVTVHLFYSEEPEIDVEAVVSDADGTVLTGATALTNAQGNGEDAVEFLWDIVAPELVPEGDYYIYAVAVGGASVAVGRGDDVVQVRHAPFLRLDPLNDRVLAGADTIVTGGDRPQRFMTFSWGRRGRDGDSDLDDDASISLFVSTKPATAEIDSSFSTMRDSVPIPAGASMLIADLGDAAEAIAAGLPEDADDRLDNQQVWDLWSFAESGGNPPLEGVVHYIYGVISDGKHSRVVQMNGGRLNDAGGRLVFQHAPSIRPLQPLADLRVGANSSARVSWEDQDLDDDALIRVILSAENHGERATYSTVTSGTAYVVNSSSGRADREIDGQFDLSEDSAIDHLDVRTAHLTQGVNTDESLQPGSYYVYFAIEDGERFNGETPTYRAPGQLVFEADGAGVPGGPFQLLPAAFTMGTGGASQSIDIVVDAGGEPVDLVKITLRAEGQRFGVLDMNSDVEGVQPFVVAEGFSAPKLVTNNLSVSEDSTLFLTLEYFDPTAEAIEGLDGTSAIARFELLSKTATGSATIDIVSLPMTSDGTEEGVTTGDVSLLEHDGISVIIAEPSPLSTANLLPGRATVRGLLHLEGRTNMTSLVDFSVREWSSYRDLVDSVYINANDLDAERPGVQVQVQADGVFELLQVPTGRLDLLAHLDGYLDAWSPRLNPFPAEEIEGIRPSSTGDPADTLMRGGDVAGYLEEDGTSRPDNEVTLADWDFVAALFDETVSAEGDSARADISGDGVVNVRDLSLVGANFLERGPRPVFKRRTVNSPTVVSPIYEWSPVLIHSGTHAQLAIEIDPHGAFTAIQFDVLYDPEQWAMDGANSLASALTAQRQHPWGSRIASVALGGTGLVADEGMAPAIEARLRRLVSAPKPPDIANVVLLNAEHRELAARRTAVASDRGPQPDQYTLAQNYPNPFNPTTTLAFSVPASSPALGRGSTVSLEVYNTIGQRIAVLVNSQLQPGDYQATWGGRDDRGRSVASGIYVYRLHVASAGDSRQFVRRMLLLR